MKGRIKELDELQGLAMLLVVLGHCYLSGEYNPRWYQQFHSWLYSFHMGVFICISGFLIRYSYRGLHSARDYGLFLLKRIRKFVPPFVLIGLLLTVGYHLLHGFSWGDFISDTVKLFLRPTVSRAIFLWYIYLLFFLYCLAPFYIMLPTWGQIAFFFFACWLSFMPSSHLFAAVMLFRLLAFFTLGMFAAEYWPQIKKSPRWGVGLLCVPFILFTVFFSNMPKIPYLLTGLSALPAVYLAATSLGEIPPIGKMLELISRNCFPIYLYQMFFIQCWLQFYRCMAKDWLPFAPILVCATVSAIWGAILVQKLLARMVHRCWCKPLNIA